MKLALLVSTVGHPFVTIPLFILLSMSHAHSPSNAVFVSLLLIGGFFVPLIVWMYVQSKRGVYTNFDVSDKKQRHSLFLVAVPLLLVVTLVLLVTHQSNTLCLSVGFALVLVALSQGVNFLIKSSLHVSLNCYLAALMLPSHPFLAFGLLGFTVPLAWSRIRLRRHSLREVLVGYVIGVGMGLLFLRTVGYWSM
jgi:membrane-associated phospholipid phosphatase